MLLFLLLYLFVLGLESKKLHSHTHALCTDTTDATDSRLQQHLMELGEEEKGEDSEKLRESNTLAPLHRAPFFTGFIGSTVQLPSIKPERQINIYINK